MTDAIQQAIDYAKQDGCAYQLHVTLTNGQTLVGATLGDSSKGIGVESADGCTFVHFINPKHVVSVRLEWL